MVNIMVEGWVGLMCVSLERGVGGVDVREFGEGVGGDTETSEIGYCKTKKSCNKMYVLLS